MEAADGYSGSGSVWRQIQARLSPKLSHRDPADRKERSLRVFRRGARKAEAAAAALARVTDRSQEQARPGSGPSLLLPPSHRKSSSEADPAGSRGGGGGAAAVAPPETQDAREGISSPGSSVAADRALSSSGMFKVEVELKRGHNLAIRDRGGSSDPYVKIKLGGKEVYRSRTIHRNLNPVWDEKTTILVECLSEPLLVKVFDYDFALHDDFMGAAPLQLDSLELHRMVPVTLLLKDPQCPDEDLGTLELSVTLRPKDSPVEERRDAAAPTTYRLKPYVNKQQAQRLAELHRKSQLWRGIANIALIEGRNLIPMDSNGLSDPYVKFRLGHQKYRSKTVSKTLCPQWREQFDLHLYEETGGVLEITVWDRDTGRRDDFIGRCQLDLSSLAKEHTHHLELPLQECQGSVVLLVTLTASAHVSIADLSVTPLDDPQERRDIQKRYSLTKSFSNVKDVGVVQVKVTRAEGLMAADVTGKSDPFCVLELNNDRLQTHTVYKNLNPEWNKAFTFNVKDVHSVLEVSVFDEDRDRSADFLGRVVIPLLSVRNGEIKGYVLKNKELTGPTKGTIYLEIDVIYNTVKAALRSLVPAEKKYIEEEPKVSKNLLQQNFLRVKRCIMVLFSYGSYINSCFEWESVQRSLLSFMVFVLVVWNFQLFMLPLSLLLLLVWNYFFSSSWDAADASMDAVFQSVDEEEDKEVRRPPVAAAASDGCASAQDSEHRSFMDKLHAIQDVFISVQSALDQVASHGERIKNTFNWTVPFLSLLAIATFSVATLLLYFVPLRYLVLAWGVNKFTKKLRNPYRIDNNELLDFLSRVPSDVQVMQYRPLKMDPGQSPCKRRRPHPS
ncbi:multiple C2 and transmembrane domain-containing protein 1-like isoform X3 [Synchiropus splendidus]|uniref:multiple C2 and transmembrane domain-containing protein 1-like isoform X3 n=1 Tax=Synchiropus splendidus TaxID=270530 RepID=UPI00237DE8DC|nr:multiple C2 and transmembrane domain-containing protein 1-like isoform X3 [Synchiropus splendidus]